MLKNDTRVAPSPCKLDALYGGRLGKAFGGLPEPCRTNINPPSEISASDALVMYAFGIFQPGNTEMYHAARAVRCSAVQHGVFAQSKYIATVPLPGWALFFCFFVDLQT